MILIVLSSFCRKTTMVKHQRRSHQRGIHSMELDDGETSDSDSADSPTTPQHSGQEHWPQNYAMLSGVSSLHQNHSLHRASSFADFGQQPMQGYGMHQGFVHRHSVAGGIPEYSPSPVLHAQTPQHLLQQSFSQRSYYVPEQNNPGVATLNTNAALGIHNYQITRPQMPDRHHSVHEIPFTSSSQQLPMMTESIQSSPGSFSSASGRSTTSQDLYYTHNTQPAAYSLNTSPIEMQQVNRFQSAPLMSQGPPQHIVSSVPRGVQSHEQYEPVSQAEEQWYGSPVYQPTVEVVAHVHPFSNVYDPWGTKIDTFDDHSLQMPSARIEEL